MGHYITKVYIDLNTDELTNALYYLCQKYDFKAIWLNNNYFYVVSSVWYKNNTTLWKHQSFCYEIEKLSLSIETINLFY